MSASPFADLQRVAACGHAGHACMLTAPPSTRQRRSAAKRPAASVRPVLDRIHALMQHHGITLAELRAKLLATRQTAPIERCPSIDHDPLYQVPPGTVVVGPFTTDWHQRRGGTK
ncbi:hypothetical protein [Azohydromonas australica]|uniref:hypothetical protein n=1 Tax=Azohydromonas australica TaxID=364039 RepID=UPI000428A530|nr:hypothetical protein [Azohydromonas australica]